MLEPIKVLGAMITPAVFISAAALLLLSTANRLGRVNDRLQRLMTESERLRAADHLASALSQKQQLILDQLAGLTERLVLLRSAVTGTYVTMALFITTSIFVGLNVVFPELNSLIPVSVGMLGAVAFLYSIVVLIVEGAIAVRLTMQDIQYVRGLIEESPGIRSGGRSER